MNHLCRRITTVLLAAILGCAASCQRSAPRPVRPPAALDFHIVVSPDSADVNIAAANEALQSGKTLPGVRWLPLRAPRFFAADSEALTTLVSNPQDYFGNRDVVAASKYDIVYILVFDDSANSMKQGSPLAYQVVDVYRDIDDLGRDALSFELDDRGGELMRAITSKNVGRPIACVVGGEVIAAPVLATAIGKSGILQGYLQPNDVTQLLRELRGAP